jgi:hypothetical protein
MLHEYNYEDRQRGIGRIPADVTAEDEKRFVQKMVNRRNAAHTFWDKKEAQARAQGKTVAEYYTVDPTNKFRKEGRHPNWSAKEYDVRKYGAGASLLLTEHGQQDAQPIVYRPLPYNIRWVTPDSEDEESD